MTETHITMCPLCKTRLWPDGKCWTIGCKLAGIKVEPLRETEDNKSLPPISAERVSGVKHNRANLLKAYAKVESRRIQGNPRIEVGEQREVEGSVRLLSGVKTIDPASDNIERYGQYTLYLSRAISLQEQEKLSQLIDIAIQGYHDSLAAQKLADGLQRAKDTVQRVHESRFEKPKDIPPSGNNSTTMNHGLSAQSLAAILDDAHNRDLTLREFRTLVTHRINLTIQYSLYTHEVDDLVLRMTGNDLESHWNSTPLR